MLGEAACTPLKAMLTMPSCVPAVTGFEDTGASIDAGDVARYMQDGRVVALGEMMNYPGILSDQEGPHAIVAETLKAGRTVTGHYSIPRPTGASTATLPPEPLLPRVHPEADALAKMRLGMYAHAAGGLRLEGFGGGGRAVTRHEVDSRFAVLVTDDAIPTLCCPRAMWTGCCAGGGGGHPSGGRRPDGHAQLCPVLPDGPGSGLRHPRPSAPIWCSSRT